MAEPITPTVELATAPETPAGGVSRWVENVRALQRPFVIALVIVGLELGLTRGIWNGVLNFGEWLTAQLALAGPITGFLFGERAALKGRNGNGGGA